MTIVRAQKRPCEASVTDKYPAKFKSSAIMVMHSISVFMPVCVLIFASCNRKEDTVMPHDSTKQQGRPLGNASPLPNAPDGFVLISEGAFQMGDQSNPPIGTADELPVHTVNVNAFYLAKYEVTKALWDEVRTWGLAHGYTDLASGDFPWILGDGKAANHPVFRVTWFQVTEWCNARSEKDNLSPCYTVDNAVMKTGTTEPAVNWLANGYRLPSEAEWEKAARGGLIAKNFPTDNIIGHSEANFVNPDGTDQPTYLTGDQPYTSPVGSFPANGYGLFDMAGNVREWCWDWHGEYAVGPQTDSHGPVLGVGRIVRGGGWDDEVQHCRVSFRDMAPPDYLGLDLGFRLARSAVP